MAQTRNLLCVNINMEEMATEVSMTDHILETEQFQTCRAPICKEILLG